MKAPQIILLALMFMSLLLAAYQHGKEETGKHNFWVSFTSMSMLALLLWWGGFFD